MEDKFLDEILEKMIEDSVNAYVDEEIEKANNQIKDEEIEFSDIHKAKMKKLFKEAKNRENKKAVAAIGKKIAIVVLCAMLITVGLVGTVDAWRREVIKFIMKSNDDNYMSITFGDDNNTEESGDIENAEDSGDNTFIIDDIHFMYVPEGFEFSKKDEGNKIQYYSFLRNNKKENLKLKKETINNTEKFIDIEKTSSEKYKFEDKEVFKVIKSDRVHYVWYIGNASYSVCSNIENEEIILKFIENIKILKNI